MCSLGDRQIHQLPKANLLAVAPFKVAGYRGLRDGPRAECLHQIAHPPLLIQVVGVSDFRHEPVSAGQENRLRLELTHDPASDLRLIPRIAQSQDGFVHRHTILPHLADAAGEVRAIVHAVRRGGTIGHSRDGFLCLSGRSCHTFWLHWAVTNVSEVQARINALLDRLVSEKWDEPNQLILWVLREVRKSSVPKQS